MPLVSWKSCLVGGVLFRSYATAFTGSEYQLSHEYSGTNFFDGWDFYSGRDPTGGFVTYYSRSSAQLTGLISASESGPAYMGVNYVDKLPFNNQTGSGDGAGRPSVRIASKEVFTHGLFIGDFDHIPAGVCGTWPAFWTLGPNWPYTGEIDIMEGVNQNTKNVMSLHTNETCIIQGNATYMTGDLENTNCAYYPDYNVGCGVSDPRPTSFGVGFNNAGGGVYAMQWTSEYIRIWQWSRSEVPSDVNSKQPDPSSWGLPAGELAVGNCTVDQHFQSHKIIFDNTFCGEYAGNPYVWKTDDVNSCADSTGLATCDDFVANNPAAFKDAYWSVNYVRVYQLVDPANSMTEPSYIASQQPTNAATNAYSAPNAVATPNIDVDSLCPQYNFSIISDGEHQYEIACDFDPPGPDIIGDPYQGFRANSLADCIKGCTYMNDNNGTNKCGGVSHFAAINFCYFKKYIDGNLSYRPGYNQIRLIYYGYPQITDDPRSVADSTLTSVFVETIPTPQSYRPSTTTSTTTSSTTTTMADISTTTTSKTSTIGAPPMGDNSTSTISTISPDYSETVTSGYLNATRTEALTTSSVASTDPSVTNSDFYIVFDVNPVPRRLSKRDIQYLAFDSQGQSILVSDQTQATRFRLGTDGMLMNSDQYVAVDSSVQPPRFSLTDGLPDTPVIVNVDNDGNVVIQDVNGYCLTSDGELAVSTDSGDLPENCASVKPQLTASPDDSTSASLTTETMTLSMISVSSTSVTETTTEASSFSVSTDSTIAFSSSSSQSSSSSMIDVDGSIVTAVITETRSFSTPSDSTIDSLDEPSQLSSSTIGVDSGTVTGVFTETDSFSAPGDSTIDSSSASSQSSLFVSDSDINTSTSPTGTSDSSSTSVSSESDLSNVPSSNTASSTRSSSAAISTSTTTQSTINDFAFAGCFGIPMNSPSTSDVSSTLSDLAMTNDVCTKHCGELKAYYAATSGVNCFCGSSEGLYAALVKYPDASCNDPCPGANRDFCGGQAGFQDAIPTTSNPVLPRRIKLLERQSVVFLVSLYNNTLLLGGPGETDVPTTTDTASNTGSDTVTTRPTSTDASFPPDAVSYNITGTDTATVISTTYVDVCHVCPGGLTTKATTITVPHCGCTASYDAAIGHSVSVPSPVVPMLTTTKTCACGHAGAQSTITVTVPHSSSIAQLSSQLPSMPMGIAAGEPGNLGAMQIPAPADAGGSVGSVPSTMDEPETLDHGAESADHESAMPDHESEDTDDNDMEGDMIVSEYDDIEDEGSVPRTNDIPLTPTASPGGNTPMNMGGQNGNVANAAAPASSPKLSGPSNTAIPVGISNYTAPAATYAGNSNGSFMGSGPIASFTSGASCLGDKFALSLVVGMVLCCLVGAW